MAKVIHKTLFFLISVSILLLSCDKEDVIAEIPKCLEPTVSSILSKPAQTPRAKIEKWFYKGEEVYFVDAQNFPDGEIFVITLNCQDTICTFGGFDGPDNDCEDWGSAIFIDTIWIDNR